MSFSCFIGVANLKMKFSIKPVLGKWKIQSQMRVSIFIQWLLCAKMLTDTNA